LPILQDRKRSSFIVMLVGITFKSPRARRLGCCEAAARVFLPFSFSRILYAL